MPLHRLSLLKMSFSCNTLLLLDHTIYRPKNIAHTPGDHREKRVSRTVSRDRERISKKVVITQCSDHGVLFAKLKFEHFNIEYIYK